MEEITGPGTITDLVADATERGYDVTTRLVRDWTEQGLLDYPLRRPAGKGHGSRPALYSANQRNLFLTLLAKRPGNGVRSLARIPVGMWMYWGDDYVVLSQARRAFMTWLGDPRISKRKARETAKAVLAQVDNPLATKRAREELLAVLTDIGYTGRIDGDHLERAVRAVFEPNSRNVRRAVGHPQAPLTTDSMVSVITARSAAVTQLQDGAVADPDFLRARQAHLITFNQYIRQQPVLAGAALESAEMYAVPTVEKMINTCCHDLLTTIGFQIRFPEVAQRIVPSQ